MSSDATLRDVTQLNSTETDSRDFQRVQDRRDPVVAQFEKLQVNYLARSVIIRIISLSVLVAAYCI